MVKKIEYDALLKKVKDLEESRDLIASKHLEVCAENDKINEKWAEERETFIACLCDSAYQELLDKVKNVMGYDGHEAEEGEVLERLKISEKVYEKYYHYKEYGEEKEDWMDGEKDKLLQKIDEHDTEVEARIETAESYKQANAFLKNIAEEQTKKINELTLKETKTHNEFVRVESEVKELKEKIEIKESAINLYQKEIDIEHERYVVEQQNAYELKVELDLLKEKLKELTHKHDLLECSSKEEAECRGLIRRDEEWYSEQEDWVWGYGYKQTSTKYTINISGGGDGVSPNGFEDWVIKKDGGKLWYYIRHGGDIPDKLQVGKKLITCPDGNYISFQDEDYEHSLEEMDFEWLEDELTEE